MTILRKYFLAGSNEVVIPGTPGYPGSPAYCIDTVVNHPGGTGIAFIPYPPHAAGDPIPGIPGGSYGSSSPGGYFEIPVTGPPTSELVHNCYPAVPPVPAGPPTRIPAVAAKYYEGWNAAADSIPSLTGDGIYEVTGDASSVGVVTGFTNSPVGVTYSNITHGIYFASGQYQYMENGTPVTPKKAFDSTDVFTIVRIGGQVTFYKDSTLDYISGIPSTGIVWADASLYFGGDQILDARIDTTVPPDKGGAGYPLPPAGPYPPATDPGTLPRYTSVNGILQGLRTGVFGDNQVNLPPGSKPGDPGMPPTVDGNGDWQGRYGSTLRSLTGRFIGNGGGNYNSGSVNGTLDSVQGKTFSVGGASNYSILRGTLAPVSGDAGAGLLVPQYVVMDGYLDGLGGFSYGIGGGTTGTLAGRLPNVHGFTTNVAGGWINSGTGTPPFGDPVGGTPGLPGWKPDADGEWLGRSGGQLRNIVGHLYSADAVLLPEAYSFFEGELSGYLLQASGHTIFGVSLGFDAALSGYSFKGYGGGSAFGTLPLLTFSGSGTVTILGEADLALSGYEFLASGTTTIIGQAYATYRGPYALTGYGGGQMVGAHGGHYLLTGQGIVGAVGRADCELPSLVLTGSGTVHNFGVLDATLPALIVAASSSAVLALSHYVFVGSGHEGFATAYEAYSITLIPTDAGGETTATTHYPTYPFDRILRFGDDYYGVAADGLYRLDGDTFDGVEIISVVETAQTDFKERSAKRPVSLFLAGRMDTKLKVSVTAAEDVKNTYTYTGTWEGVGNQRVRFGRGIKARYLSYGFTNHTGEDFDVDELAPEIEVLRRNQ